MKLLELFSGTHSIGKIAKEQGYEVYSLDRDLGAECPLKSDYKSDKHFKEDIMTFNYKQFPKGYFKVITASPVCTWWSGMRRTWIGRKCKLIHPTDIITQEHINNDIDKYGKPMVDKIIEIIDYFQPEYWWIENPQTGRLKEYMKEKYENYNTYYDVDYCKYSDWGYKKRTRFWTNISDFVPLKCKNDCENVIKIPATRCGKMVHKTNLLVTKYIEENGKIITVNTKKKREKYKDNKCIMKYRKPRNILERYRIPPKLIDDLLSKCY